MLNRWNFLKTGFCEGIKSVFKDDLALAATALESRETAPSLDEDPRDRHIKSLRAHKRRQLDLLAENPAGGLAVGEFKSWGGYFGGPPTWKLVKSEFVGEWNGSLFVLRSIEGRKVTEWVLVLWERSHEHSDIESHLSNLYGIPVRVYYLDEIYKNLGPNASDLRKEHLEKLYEAVDRVRTMVRG